MRPVTVITGAGSGIGAALAEASARRGEALILAGRDRTRLESVAEACRAHGAEATVTPLDVTDAAACVDWAAALLARFSIKRVIANAGVSSGIGPDGRMETLEAALQTVQVNLQGAMNTVHPFLDAMQRDGRGQVVFIGSLAGLRGMPGSPAYSASKAGVLAYGEALRVWYRPYGVDIRVICPGYVTSKMSERIIGGKPLEISAEEAADYMLRKLDGRRAVIVFPRLLGLGIGLLRLLPTCWADRLLSGPFGYRVKG